MGHMGNQDTSCKSNGLDDLASILAFISSVSAYTFTVPSHVETSGVPQVGGAMAGDILESKFTNS
jgi:hypothetical protein